MKVLERWLTAKWMCNMPPVVCRVVQAARSWVWAWQNDTDPGIRHRTTFELFNAVDELEDLMGPDLGRPRRP